MNKENTPERAQLTDAEADAIIESVEIGPNVIPYCSRGKIEEVIELMRSINSKKTTLRCI